MPDARNLPTSSIPRQWAEVDTSIDEQPFEALSEDQMRQHIGTIVALLRASGLWVDHTSEGDLRITRPGDDHPDRYLEVRLHDDRAAEWELYDGGQTEVGTPATETAARIVAFFPPDERAFDNRD